ncbi:MAG: hypothetical protein WD004_08295 [Actinomycetota bacterium]
MIEFSCKAKPGHFTEVSELYSGFAADFLSTHEALETVVVFADEASGVVRGLGLYETREAAESVNSDPGFAAFNDSIGPLLAEPADRREYSLLHLFSAD